MAKKFEFSYPYASYMDVSLMRETKTKKELLAEYTAMQKEANRRLKQLSKLKWTRESAAYQYNEGRYTRSAKRMTKQKIAEQMRDAARFLAAQTSTVTGQREARNRMLYTFREQWGIEGINKSNLGDFVRFLEAARKNLGAGAYNMNEIEAMFRVARSKRLNTDAIVKDFNAFMEKAKDSSLYDRYMAETEERYSSDDYDRNPIFS